MKKALRANDGGRDEGRSERTKGSDFIIPSFLPLTHVAVSLRCPPQAEARGGGSDYFCLLSSMASRHPLFPPLPPEMAPSSLSHPVANNHKFCDGGGGEGGDATAQKDVNLGGREEEREGGRERKSDLG